MPATTSLVVTASGPPAGTVLSMSTASFLGRQLKTRVSVCTDTKHREHCSPEQVPGSTGSRVPLWQKLHACARQYVAELIAHISLCKACTTASHSCVGQCVYTKSGTLSCSAANREREFVRMLIAASITYEIARACREKLIPDCHCAPSDIPFITKVNGTLIIAGCDVDMGWAAAYTRLIMNGSDGRIEQHNIEVGITVSAVLEWWGEGEDR